MLSKEEQITHTLILAKKGERDKEFNDTIIELIKKIESYNLIDQDESKKIIESIDAYTLALNGRVSNASLVKYIFPVFIRGTYIEKDVGNLWDKAKKEFQEKLKSDKYKDYYLYNRISYELKENELEKINEIISENPYFKQLPPDEWYITLRVAAEMDKFNKILEIAREIEEHINRSHIPFAPTHFDNVKKGFEMLKLSLVNNVKEDMELRSRLKERLKKDEESKCLDDNTPQEIVDHCLDAGFFTLIYTKEMFGIPLPEFLKGQGKLYADLKYLQTKYPMEGVGLNISINASITNENDLSSLGSCQLDGVIC